MKIAKYQILASHGDEPAQAIGWAMACKEWGPWMLVSTVPLLKNTTQRYFAKTFEHELPPKEVFVEEEIVSGDWRVDPAPHIYQIKPQEY